MKVVISFKHLEHTPALDEKIHQKSEKFQKYFEGNFEVFWTCYVDQSQHVADLKINGPSFSYHATGKADTLYKSFDLVVSKIEAQIKKKKGKWKDHIHHKHSQAAKNIPINEQILKEEYYKNNSDDDQYVA